MDTRAPGNSFCVVPIVCLQTGTPSCDNLTNQLLIINPLFCKPPFTPSQLFLVLLGQDEHHKLEGRQIPRSGSGPCLEANIT